MFGDFYPFENYNKITQFLATNQPEDLKADDMLLVWGGEDISPSLYNKTKSIFGGGNPRPSRRDALEWAMMNKAKDLGVPIMGICRGAQMLCALAGGFLCQHMQHHPGGRHTVTTNTGRNIITNSLHHQMMYPFDVKHEMLASVKRPGAHYDVDELVKVPEDPEFVYFPEVKGFAVQWHPEMMAPDCEATQYIFDQLDEKLDVRPA